MIFLHSKLFQCLFVLALAPLVFSTFAADSASSPKPLAGKRICIDPGHGGGSSGATGKGGTTEKDVNLKVSLKLKDMLEGAGATVIMVRTDDTDIGIRERAELNKEKNTDLFVSVHHNANAQGDDDMNRIEVFWHWKDDGGPSEDLARLILREMQATSGRPGKAYVCWAYGVLRENSYPAVLGEYSYLQNPDEEKRLNDDKYLTDEAACYYRAILEFFTSGRPEIDLNDEPLKAGKVEFKVTAPEGTSLVDPQRIMVREQGKLLNMHRYNPATGSAVYWANWKPNAKSNFTISAFNLAGRVSEVERQDIQFGKTPAPMTLEAQPAILNGAISGKTIVIDPAGGGDDAVAVAPNGLRASDANLLTAFYLVDYLRRAGANVIMTRDRDEARDNVARVRIGLENDPDVFLTIGYRMPETGMGEKPGQNITRIGSRWGDSKAISNALIFHLREGLGTGTEAGDVTSREALPSEIHNWSSWEAMHGAQKYTSNHVSALMFDAPGAAERLSTMSGNRKAALAILYGLGEYFGQKEQEMGRIDGIVKDAKTGNTVGDALIWLNGLMPVQTEADGRFTLKYIKLGSTIELLVQAQGFKMEKKQLEIKDSKSQQIEISLK